MNSGKTGWPPGLLQDDSRGLSRWFASRPNARAEARAVALSIMNAPLTAQQVYDKVLFALRTQGKAATNAAGKCVYRGVENTKCAFGHLIPDELYHPSMEGIGAREVMGLFKNLDGHGIKYRHECPDTAKQISALFSADIPPMLFVCLQLAHDRQLCASSQQWEQEMERIATNFGLKYTAL